MTEKLINIAVPGTPVKYFTYTQPEKLSIRLSPGQRCIVPLGRRQVIGYFTGAAKTKPSVKLKPILDILDPQSLFDAELFKFLGWMAKYYLTGPADVMQAALPPAMRKIKKPSFYPGNQFKKEFIETRLPQNMADKIISGKGLSPTDTTRLENKYPGLISELLHDDIIKPGWAGAGENDDSVCLGYILNPARDPDSKWRQELNNIKSETGLFQKKEIVSSGVSAYRVGKLIETGVLSPVYGLPDLFSYIKPRPKVTALRPNDEQRLAIDCIKDNLSSFKAFLLYGITGSGKTLVYVQAAEQVLKSGRTVLVLVPEIALAGTLLSYFKSFFSEKIALLHSGLKPKERLIIHQNIKNGQYKIVIGARSAIFAPLDKIGLIIVDEEHDESYKQDDPAPRFHGRDAAVMRAKMAGIPVILGSASPSFESFYNAQKGRYELLKLTQRPEKAEIPVVQLVDLKKERPSSDASFFTRTLINKVKQSLANNQQVILYLNRRGFSPRIKCTDCGHTPLCPHCEISLTWHKSGYRLMCHFCGYIKTAYNSCESCGGNKFLFIGTGTQKIEEKIGEIFEEARMIRLDSDMARGREQAYQVLAEFAAGKYNLLLGTQMVTKGIDFPDVSLVGVLMADIGMDMPDFRASEKLFSKLIQVAGRSGRGIIPGEVVIQTYNPEKDLIDDAARQDYDTFFERELKSRRSLSYPPFSHLVNFRFASKKENGLSKATHEFKKQLEAKTKSAGLKVHILGPAPCPLYRLRGLYRRHMFIKTGQIMKVVGLLDHWRTLEPFFGLPSGIRMTIDIDPYDML